MAGEPAQEGSGWLSPGFLVPATLPCLFRSVLAPFPCTRFPPPTLPGPPGPPTPFSQGLLSALGLPAALPAAGVGDVEKSEEIPGASGAAGLLGFPLAHSDSWWLACTGFKD